MAHTVARMVMHVRARLQLRQRARPECCPAARLGRAGESQCPLSLNSIGYAQCTKSQRIRRPPDCAKHSMSVLQHAAAAVAATTCDAAQYHVRCSRVQRSMQHSTTFDAAQYNVRCAAEQWLRLWPESAAAADGMCAIAIECDALAVLSQRTAGHVRQLIDGSASSGCRL